MYDKPEYASLRKGLHAHTFDWMEGFGDAGLTWEVILKPTIYEEAWLAVLLRG